MSDIPKTLQEECYGTCWAACERIEELESQLRAASNRIKRLEEAGDVLSRYLREMPYASGYLAQVDERILRISNWRKAKEEKP